MLKLQRTLDAIKSNIEFDFYIPIKIRFDTTINEPTHCLGIKTADEKALIEITIGKFSGNLKYITLVLSPKIQKTFPIEKYPTKNELHGLPIFETQKFANLDYYSNTTKDFKVYLNPNQMLIVLEPNKIESKVINNRVALGFDKDNHLCSIEIKDISHDEKAILEESLRVTGAI